MKVGKADRHDPAGLAMTDPMKVGLDGGGGAEGVVDDVIDDVAGGVVDAAGFADFGLSSTLAMPLGVRRMTLPRNCS